MGPMWMDGSLGVAGRGRRSAVGRAQVCGDDRSSAEEPLGWSSRVRWATRTAGCGNGISEAEETVMDRLEAADPTEGLLKIRKTEVFTAMTSQRSERQRRPRDGTSWYDLFSHTTRDGGSSKQRQVRQCKRTAGTLSFPRGRVESCRVGAGTSGWTKVGGGGGGPQRQALHWTGKGLVEAAPGLGAGVSACQPHCSTQLPGPGPREGKCKGELEGGSCRLV